MDVEGGSGVPLFERLTASSLIEVHTRRHKPAWFSRVHLYFKVFGKEQHGSNAYNHWSLWTNFYSNRHRDIFVLSIVCYFILFLSYIYQYIFVSVYHLYPDYRGGSRGAHPARAPLKIGKNMIFWHKIVIFHTKYPKKYRASLRSAQFFLSAPPNLKSWIRPWAMLFFSLFFFVLVPSIYYLAFAASLLSTQL